MNWWNTHIIFATDILIIGGHISIGETYSKIGFFSTYQSCEHYQRDEQEMMKICLEKDIPFHFQLEGSLYCKELFTFHVRCFHVVCHLEFQQVNSKQKFWKKFHNDV